MINFETEIVKLKKDLNAVILSHFYQDEEIQDIADFVGDSLDLSRKATTTNADVIILCGVKFMAEVAKILNPNKIVLIPDMNAGCSLEESCKPVEFAKFKEKHPDHLTLTYINCSAEIKALSDIIVTSSNAVKIIEQIPKDQKIIFAPDRHLGSYISKKTGRDMLLWHGSCIVHEQFSQKELIKLKTRYNKAKIIAHPECPEHLLSYADHIGSTSSLLKFATEEVGGEFIVLTEPGIIHQMKKANPAGKFYDCPGINQSGCVLCNTCPYMQLNNLEKLYKTMKNRSNEITLSKNLIKKASASLEKMLEMS
ncbi:MAG: quinolinate synthase [Rickettsiales bacterium]|jgi:quinolinate synthase